MVQSKARTVFRVALLLLFGLGAGCTYSPASFDLNAARRQADLAQLEVPGSVRIEEGVALREVRFSSTSWDTGSPQPIRIQAFLAIPAGSHAPHSKPAVIYAHGLGGQGDPKTAVELARNLDVVALSLSGPGLGESEGTPLTPENPKALFAGGDDIRKNWLYTYVYAILRAITYLETRSEVDPRGVALTGFSLGGVATFIANGVDDRIRGALPVAASGGLAQAAGDNTWLRTLVESAKLGPEDPGLKALFRSLDPLAYARRQKGAVYMLVGAQDEYFPLEEALATYRALWAPDKSLTVIADYDHGWYFGGGCPAACMPGSNTPKAKDCPKAPVCPEACPQGALWPYCGPQKSYNRQSDFSARWALLMRALVAQHVAREKRPFSPPPDPPDVKSDDGEIIVKATAAAQTVRLAISEDCGFTYAQIPLVRGQDGAYHHRKSVPANAIVFAEVELPDGAVATSVPTWPKTCKLNLRPFGPRP